MNLDRAVLRFAGFIVLLSVVLAWFVHPYWIALAAFAGLNLIQASFTCFCPAAMLFKRFGVRQGTVFR